MPRDAEPGTLLARPPAASHVALLARDPLHLQRALAAFVGEGLRAGEAVVAFASARSRAVLRSVLSADGPRLLPLQGQPRLTLIPAEGALPRLLAEGWPDRARFEASVAGPVRAAQRRHGRVRVYGDIVDLLRRGRFRQALLLERLWEELVAECGAPLLCAYSLDCFDRRSWSGPLQGLARCHSHLLPGQGALFQSAVAGALRSLPLAVRTGRPPAGGSAFARQAPRARMPRAMRALVELQERRPALVGRALSLARDKARSSAWRRALAHERRLGELSRLAARLAAGREQERLRLARELREDVAQLAAAICLHAEMARRQLASRGTVGAALETLGRLADRVVATLRLLSEELLPAALDALGLVTALEGLARDFEGRTGARCRLKIALPREPPVWAAASAYRTVAAALRSLDRPRSAVGVAVGLRGGRVSIRVASRAAGAARAWDGLDSSREQALALGGAWRVHPGRPASLEVGLPLGAAERAGGGPAGGPQSPAPPKPGGPGAPASRPRFTA